MIDCSTGRVRHRMLFCVLVSLALAWLPAGCGDEPQPPRVKLVAEPSEHGRPSEKPGRAALRIAIAPVISPRVNFRLYEPLVDYLGTKLDRPVEFVQRPTYAEINDLVRNGHADVAFVCDYAYVVGQRDFGMKMLVAPQVMGQLTYRSLLIVPATSGARSLGDLRGRSFAFSDPLSSSGWLYPAYLLKLRDERPSSFFSRTVFTRSHDNTVQAVADRLVDGGAVDSLVYEFMLRRDRGLGDRLRVIGQSTAWGNPPVVTHPRIDGAIRRRLLEIFVGMHEDPQAKPFLADLMIDRFVVLDESYYHDVRAMAARVEVP